MRHGGLAFLLWAFAENSPGAYFGHDIFSRLIHNDELLTRSQTRVSVSRFKAW